MSLSTQTKTYIQSGLASKDAADELTSAVDTVLVGQMSEQLVKYADTTISTAQMLALNTTPIQLVAAPGAGKAIVVTEVFASLVFNSAAYSAAAGGASLFYKSDASGQACGTTLTQGFLQSSSGTNFQYVRGGTTAITDVTANWANQPVVIKAATSNPTTGDSAVKVRVYYRVVPAPLA